MSAKIIIIGEASEKAIKFALENNFEIVMCNEISAIELERGLIIDGINNKPMSYEDILTDSIEPIKSPYYKPDNRPTKEDRRNWRKYGK